jgi:hypothetical protein
MTDFTDHVRLDINVSDDVAEKLDAMTEQEQVECVERALTCTWDELRADPKLARRPGGVDIVSDGKRICRVSIPCEPLVDDDEDELRAQLLAANRELERWRHGATVEGDYVCEYAFDREQLDETRLALVGLLDAFPRLGKDYSEANQQAALREARKAVGR